MEPSRLDALPDVVGRGGGLGGVDRGVARAVHRDEVTGANQQVQLQQVHMAGLAGQGGVHDDEGVLLVSVDGGHEVAVATGSDDQRVGPEGVPEHLLGVGLELGDVDPGEAVGTGQEGVELGSGVLLNAGLVNERNAHGTCLFSSLGDSMWQLRRVVPH